MAKKLNTALPLTLPTFHRYAAFELLDPQDYDELAPGTLFGQWVQANTAARLADPTILTRTKALYVALSKKEYQAYAHPATVHERFRTKRLSTKTERRSDGVYQVQYVSPVVLKTAIAETLPAWAVEYLEQAGAGYGSEEEFERLMWQVCISPEQEAFLNKHRLTLNHLNEGRYDGSLCDQVYAFHADWNAKLGERFWGG